MDEESTTTLIKSVIGLAGGAVGLKLLEWLLGRSAAARADMREDIRDLRLELHDLRQENRELREDLDRVADERDALRLKLHEERLKNGGSS